MVARPSIPIRSCNAGEFTPEVAGRVDIKQYYSAGLAFKNIEPVPQSGFRRMGGSRHIGEWRRPLEDRAITGESFNAGPHTGTQTIWSGAAAGAVATVSVRDLTISAGSATFSVEAQIAGVWSTIAGPFAVAAGKPATRIAAFPPGRQQVATALRIQATFSESATVSGLTVAAHTEAGTPLRPRFVTLAMDDGNIVVGFVSASIVDFFTEEAGYVGSAPIGGLTTAMLPDLDFYAEGRTIGVFHGDLQTARLFLATAGQLHDWRNDLWPYDPVPKADLGGDYPKTDDVWEVMIRWGDSSGQALTLVATVNGETTEGVSLVDGAGDPVTVGAATTAQWNSFYAALAVAIGGLPSLRPTVTVTSNNKGSSSRRVVITFGGSLSGEEFEFSAIVANTAAVSALPYHTKIGKTEYEDMFSADRGWPGTMTLIQDRASYARAEVVPGAMAMSRIGEYFDLNADAKQDNAARLDKLRSQTSELILQVKEAGYIFVFTDRGVYFVPNRTIERNTPLNFVLASEIGIQPNCRPFDLEGELYYVAINPAGLPASGSGGRQLCRISEKVTSSNTSFEAEAVSLLATHLVDKIIRSVRQRPDSDLDASKGWLMRTDGRLIATQMIKNQDINGYCEWIGAAGGLVREIGIDGRNKLWLAIERADRTSIELYDRASYLQDAVTMVPDLSGVVSALHFEDGAELWAVADGYVLGPFTCTAGSIDLEDAYANALVGRWIAPRWESMPQVLVVGEDQVIIRPGRIHTMHIKIADTTSIAVGANGEAPVNIALNETGDPTDQPMPAKTKTITVSGDVLQGCVEGPTAVITQIRPGDLRVRDIGMGVKL